MGAAQQLQQHRLDLPHPAVKFDSCIPKWALIYLGQMGKKSKARRCQAKTAHMRQSRPLSGLGF
jgi:hypothetical protein